MGKIFSIIFGPFNRQAEVSSFHALQPGVSSSETVAERLTICKECVDFYHKRLEEMAEKLRAMAKLVYVYPSYRTRSSASPTTVFGIFPS